VWPHIGTLFRWIVMPPSFFDHGDGGIAGRSPVIPAWPTLNRLLMMECEASSRM
jgi:hypothetical protein